ncbi:MAG: M15 family metallopeptidase [Lachnospiraceae bacterium]|nr:M15 family metallopeptidase [Lachnospiraceae bacterium]
MKRRQKKRLINFLAGVLCILSLGMVIGTVYAGNLNRSNTEEEVIDEGKLLGEEAFRMAKETDASPEEETEEVWEEDLPDDWNLILVNRTHPLPDDFEVELKSIGGGHKIDARAYEDYMAMVKAARKDGVYIYVTSSYRTMDKQIALHEAKIEEGVMMDYSYAEAKERAAEVVAVPGTSEHQAGLALDFVSSEYRRLDEKQEKTKGFQWLKENCYDYGFILRYPNGKTEVTGIIYEPWHFRYVGEKAALEMKETGQTLEEYLGAIPISKGTPVEYDSSMAEKKKQQSGRQAVPVQVPEDMAVPETEGEEDETDDGNYDSSEPQEPAAPVIPEAADPPAAPQEPETPVVPPAETVPPQEPSQPEQPPEAPPPVTQEPEAPPVQPETPPEPEAPPEPETPPQQEAPPDPEPPADPPQEAPVETPPVV